MGFTLLNLMPNGDPIAYTEQVAEQVLPRVAGL